MAAYDNLLQALKDTGIPFAEDGWSVAPKNQSYGVCSIEMQFDSQWADGHMQEQGIEGSIDLYSVGNGIAEARLIQQALNGADGVSWEFSSRQMEFDTGLVHWEWIWRVITL